MTHRGVHRGRRWRRGPVLVATVVLALAAAGAAAWNATASPAAKSAITYQVTGKTTVAKQNLTFRLGHTQILAEIFGGNGHPYQVRFTADLPLPPQKVSFTADGTTPESATVSFTQVGTVRGGLVNADKKFMERSRAMYTVSLTDVTIDGKAVDVGDACQTIDPVVVHASTPMGSRFYLGGGGTITSRYAIGNFANCGSETDRINSQIPGGGNFISLTLSKGKFVTP